MSGRAWTEAEDDAARRLYPVGGPQAALAALPGRTLNAVHVRAHLLGCTRRPHWTASEDDRLRLLWGDGLALPRIARERDAYGEEAEHLDAAVRDVREPGESTLQAVQRLVTERKEG